MKAYNQKIIETPTYLEIYNYEAIITPKQKAVQNKINLKRKKELAWVYEEENPTTEKRKNYDEQLLFVSEENKTLYLDY